MQSKECRVDSSFVCAAAYSGKMLPVRMEDTTQPFLLQSFEWLGFDSTSRKFGLALPAFDKCQVQVLSDAILITDVSATAIITGGRLSMRSLKKQWSLGNPDMVIDSVTGPPPKEMRLCWKGRGAFDSAKNHKRQRRKRQSVTTKRAESQTPKFV